VGCLGVLPHGSSSLFIGSLFIHLFLIRSYSWLGHGNILLKKEAIVSLVAVIVGVCQP
jgi:hypothetical protein